MVQNDHLQSNPGAIEALKAATRQVVHPIRGDASNGVQPAENPGSLAMTSPAAPTARGEPKQKPQLMPASGNFAEVFVRKITSIEQEKAKIEKEQLVVEQELSRVEKLQSDLTEKKKQLENRRNELIQVKDKLTALDKEMTDFLSKRSEL